MKTEIINALDKFERKYIKWDFIYIVLAIFAVIWIFHTVTREVEVIDKVQAKEVKDVLEVKKTTIKWNNRVYAVQVWWDRVETMRNMWLSETRILDLLAIMNMECGSYKWDCFNWNDIWPMQINKIHKEQYNKSWEYYNNQDWGGLFEYQIQYANQLVQSYEDRFCGRHIFDLIWKEYSNQKRWNCVGKSYNWHPRYKYAYMDLWWIRRQEIKKMMWY